MVKKLEVQTNDKGEITSPSYLEADVLPVWTNSAQSEF